MRINKVRITARPMTGQSPREDSGLGSGDRCGVGVSEGLGVGVRAGVAAGGVIPFK